MLLIDSKFLPQQVPLVSTTGFFVFCTLFCNPQQRAAMPELLENKSERLQARPTLLHSSTMVGHRVGFAPTPHCEPGAERTRGVETGREQGSRVLISLDQKMTFPWGIFLTFWNACFFFFSCGSCSFQCAHKHTAPSCSQDKVQNSSSFVTCAPTLLAFFT